MNPTNALGGSLISGLLECCGFFFQIAPLMNPTNGVGGIQKATDVHHNHSEIVGTCFAFLYPSETPVKLESVFAGCHIQFLSSHQPPTADHKPPTTNRR